MVLGEKPYAEMQGDSVDLALPKESLQALANMKKTGIPLVVVLYSGRPVILDRIPEEAEALLAAWLPGSEGQGIADVIFGDHNPAGKLSHSWPRSLSQVPKHLGDPDFEPLYSLGYGLSFTK